VCARRTGSNFDANFVLVGRGWEGGNWWLVTGDWWGKEKGAWRGRVKRGFPTGYIGPDFRTLGESIGLHKPETKRRGAARRTLSAILRPAPWPPFR
jgi:hypothetical protein